MKILPMKGSWKQQALAETSTRWTARDIVDKARLPYPDGSRDANFSRDVVNRLDLEGIHDFQVLNSHKGFCCEYAGRCFLDDARLSFASLDLLARDRQRAKQGRRSGTLCRLKVGIA